MKQEKIYDVIVGLIEELDDEHKEKLIKLLNKQTEAPLSELTDYLDKVRLPTVGEMKASKAGMQYQTVKSHVVSTWPSMFDHHDFKGVMRAMEIEINAFPEFGHASELYRKWNDTVDALKRIVNGIAAHQNRKS
ncbi:hypothetical protein CF95_gp066 [Erwinia phage PhiEaH1]|uniref:Uncharacterized protein n=1 Tax=Erwinia phage PhiEaH1 TaxID=1401669 RepID=W8D0G5_9CAUD|nr:hypothetical protein CF95_gp066 [Erwinia phage PhiEaH1]AGX01788.1 hypothetical protein [Erwinia phage PhiEaH1]WBF04781.1 hypothetical protein [Erwinia phage vB_Ea277G]